MSGYFDDPDLIRQVPILRAAYSDRTAWILAEIARLVYERLPQEVRVDELVQRILQSARTNRGEAVVRELVAAPSRTASRWMAWWRPRWRKRGSSCSKALRSRTVKRSSCA